jgi:hypothetical protein
MEELKEDEGELFSVLSDEVIIEREVIYISSDDEAEDNGDFFVPSPVRHPPPQDASQQLVISTDASCNSRTAAGTCVILNDAYFGTQTITLPVLPGNDSQIAELAAMTEAVRWGCQLVRAAQTKGHCEVKTLHIVSDCKTTVEWWQKP